jgi:hypothetical protein
LKPELDNSPLTPEELDSDLLHVLSCKFYLQFSRLVNQTLAKAPQRLRDDLAERLQEKASVYGRLDDDDTHDDSVYCPFCSTLMTATNIETETCSGCTNSLKGIKD